MGDHLGQDRKQPGGLQLLCSDHRRSESGDGGSIFEGSQSVWADQDWGGDRDFLEAHCPEFTTDSADPTCGDFERIGPAGATDLTSAAYGADHAGLVVSAVERAASNTGTIWAATNTGRVFISDNANATPATAVVWTRLDPSSNGNWSPNR